MPIPADYSFDEGGRERHVDVVNVLLEKGADVNAKTKEGRTALMMAVLERNQMEIAKALLQRGADVNAKDEEGQTALTAAVKRDHAEVAKLLRDCGAETTLIDAAQSGDLEEVWHLLKKGEDVNAKDEDGTALIQASSQVTWT